MSLSNKLKILSIFFTLVVSVTSYSITLYADDVCQSKDSITIPLEVDECFALIPNVPMDLSTLSACASAITTLTPTQNCGPGMLGSAGMKIKENADGKSLTVSGYVNSISNFMGMTPATNPYMCPQGCGVMGCPTAGYSCLGYCPEPGSSSLYRCPKDRNAGAQCNENALYATKLDVGTFYVDICASFSPNFKSFTAIGSMKITKSALSAGAIVGIVIGALVVIGAVTMGILYKKKLGPFKPKPVTETTSNSTESTDPEKAKKDSMNPVMVDNPSKLVVRSVA